MESPNPTPDELKRVLEAVAKNEKLVLQFSGKTCGKNEIIDAAARDIKNFCAFAEFDIEKLLEATDPLNLPDHKFLIE